MGINKAFGKETYGDSYADLMPFVTKMCGSEYELLKSWINGSFSTFYCVLLTLRLRIKGLLSFRRIVR